MSGLRRLERQIVMTKSYNETHNNKNFSSNWNDYKKSKHNGDVKVLESARKASTKKKRVFFGGKLIDEIFMQKARIKAYRDSLKAESKDEEDTVVEDVKEIGDLVTE